MFYFSIYILYICIFGNNNPNWLICFRRLKPPASVCWNMLKSVSCHPFHLKSDLARSCQNVCFYSRGSFYFWGPRPYQSWGMTLEDLSLTAHDVGLLSTFIMLDMLSGNYQWFKLNPCVTGANIYKHPKYLSTYRLHNSWNRCEVNTDQRGCVGTCPAIPKTLIRETQPTSGQLESMNPQIIWQHVIPSGNLT